MWPLAAFVSASTFILPLINNNTFGDLEVTVMMGGAGLMQGVVMALTLVWLFGMTRTEPLKRGLEAGQVEQAARNLSDNQNVDDVIGEYQAEHTLEGYQ
jgi:hypothetical protein